MMHFPIDWPSFTVGVLATWAGSSLIVCVLARKRPEPEAEQLPLVPRWAAAHPAGKQRLLDAATLRALDAELEEFRRQEGLA